MSAMELDTRKMLSAQTKISNGFHSGAQHTAGARPAHSSNNSSINTAITWFQPDGVLGPPCLIPTSSLNGGLFVKPMHGLAQSSKFFPHCCRRRDGSCPSFQKHISQHLGADRVECTRHIHRNNKQLFSPLVCFPQTFHQEGDDVQALHTRPEPNQLIREGSELFVQNLPHAHFIHFVQCRNQGDRTPVGQL